MEKLARGVNSGDITLSAYRVYPLERVMLMIARHRCAGRAKPLRFDNTVLHRAGRANEVHVKDGA
jgi:hypothetical protein